MASLSPGRTTKSAAELEDIIRSQFEEEEKEHMMRQHTITEAVEAYGQEAVTAALGADLKPDGSARVLHDGTHGVGKNPQVVPRDQTRNPGPGEAKVVMAHESRRGCCTLGLTADVKKAHRRYRVAPEDWQHQLSRLGDTVWANEVGTFGMGSASYWWSRLFGCAGRLVMYTLMHHPFWQLIYADDTKWTASGPKAITHLVLALFIFTLMGFPWSWGKCRGGPTLEWVGYWMDYATFSVGISESRARWLVDWAACSEHHLHAKPHRGAGPVGLCMWSTGCIPPLPGTGVRLGVFCSGNGDLADSCSGGLHHEVPRGPPPRRRPAVALHS